MFFITSYKISAHDPIRVNISYAVVAVQYNQNFISLVSYFTGPLGWL